MESNLYFEVSDLPAPRGEYVLWCDGMGTGRELNRQLFRAASFVFKVHMAFGIATREFADVQSYPVMDGLYVTSPSRETIREVIKLAFTEMGKEFICRRHTKNMFMMRAGLAFGPVIHGTDIPDAAIGDNQAALSTKSALLLSPAMVAAYHGEGKAPPFGVYVDETAQCIPILADGDDTGFQSFLYHWWIGGDEETYKVAKQMHTEIGFYCDMADQHSLELGYPKDRIAKHRQLAEEYFGGLVHTEEA